MYCNRCGNNLPPESQFCNRCGNRVQAEGRSHRPNSIPPPRVRPARRRLVVEDQYTEAPYFEDEYEQPADFAEEPGLETEGEETIFTIYPAFYGIAAQYVIAILLSIAVTAAIAYFNLPLWIALAFAAICFIRPFYNHIQHNHTVYKLTSVKVEIKSGLFSKTSRNIPLRHIQDVTVSESFRERLIGIGDVVIDSAAVEGKILMPNIKDPRKYAEMILNQLQYWNY
jgi:membrane protein YdbS with pleckstrin-like domain